MSPPALSTQVLPSPLPGVSLWRVDLDQPLPAQAHASLAAAELERSSRFHFAVDRHRYRVARAALRQLLASRSGVDPASVVLALLEHGKPALAAPGEQLHFNISHSAGVALMAIAHAAPVGVDVECVREVADAPALAREHFTVAENAELLALPAALRARAFLRGWTRKEACLKAWGLGLAMPPRRVEVRIAPLPCVVASPDPCLGGPLQLVSLALPDNDPLEAAVALGTAGGARQR